MVTKTEDEDVELGERRKAQDWQVITTADKFNLTHRMKVPGGWLVRSYDWCTGHDDADRPTSSMAYVPDPEHTWVIS